MKINDTGDIFEVIQKSVYGLRSSCYGRLDINMDAAIPLIFSWTFKILQFSPPIRYIICIGIDSSNKMHCNNLFADYNDNECKKTPFYALTS